MCLLMDHIATICVPVTQQPRNTPRTLMLYHASACCIRRRLEAFRRALDMLMQDSYYTNMVTLYVNCILQVGRAATTLSWSRSTSTASCR